MWPNCFSFVPSAVWSNIIGPLELFLSQSDECQSSIPSLLALFFFFCLHQYLMGNVWLVTFVCLLSCKNKPYLGADISFADDSNRPLWPQTWLREPRDSTKTLKVKARQLNNALSFCSILFTFDQRSLWCTLRIFLSSFFLKMKPRCNNSAFVLELLKNRKLRRDGNRINKAVAPSRSVLKMLLLMADVSTFLNSNSASGEISLFCLCLNKCCLFGKYTKLSRPWH